MPKQFHVSYNLEHVLKTVWDDHESLFLVIDNRPATRDEILEVAKEALNKGYKVLPSCDNVNKEGRCMGHEFEEEI